MPFCFAGFQLSTILAVILVILLTLHKKLKHPVAVWVPTCFQDRLQEQNHFLKL